MYISGCISIYLGVKGVNPSRPPSFLPSFLTFVVQQGEGLRCHHARRGGSFHGVRRALDGEILPGSNHEFAVYQKMEQLVRTEGRRHAQVKVNDPETDEVALAMGDERDTDMSRDAVLIQRECRRLGRIGQSRRRNRYLKVRSVGGGGRGDRVHEGEG